MKRWLGFRRDWSLGSTRRPGWRLAWYEPRRQAGVYLPIPFHWIARGIREIGYRLKVAWSAPRLEVREYQEATRNFRDRERMAEEFARGYLCGWRECFDACKEAMSVEVAKSNWN